MAKQQSFGDKAKGKKNDWLIPVRIVRSVKCDKGSYKFNESILLVDCPPKVLSSAGNTKPIPDLSKIDFVD